MIMSPTLQTHSYKAKPSQAKAFKHPHTHEFMTLLEHSILKAKQWLIVFSS